MLDLRFCFCFELYFAFQRYQISKCSMTNIESTQSLKKSQNAVYWSMIIGVLISDKSNTIIKLNDDGMSNFSML